MFRLKESIAYAKAAGLLGKNPIRELARIMWPNSQEHSAYMNFRNLRNGTTKKIDVECVPELCKRLGVSAEYLFGISDVPNRVNLQEEISSCAKELVKLTEQL